MIHPKENIIAPPRMTFLEKQSRAEAEPQLLLQFLSSGEVYTSAMLAAQLLACSTSSADRTLSILMRDGCLKSEIHLVNSRYLRIWGITPHGLGLVGKFDARYFELGKTNSAYIPHHLDTQFARLNAEGNGWKNWEPGKILHGMGLEKVPDALASSPDGRRVAVEVERHIKTTKRYSEIISAHLQAITQKRWAEVHYLCPGSLHKKIEAAFTHIESVLVKGERVSLQQKHRDCFKFFALDSWPTSEKGE